MAQVLFFFVTFVFRENHVFWIDKFKICKDAEKFQCGLQEERAAFS